MTQTQELWLHLFAHCLPHTGKAIKGNREKYTIATKFGIRYEDGKQIIDGSPQNVRACCEDSLKRLQTSYIDL